MFIFMEGFTMNKKIMELVTRICNSNFTDCRGLSNRDFAFELLALANVPTTAEIQEIPLNNDMQVVILFLLPNDNNYYSLFSGIGTDDIFHFELAICGQLEIDTFNFYDDDKVIDINYFLTN